MLEFDYLQNQRNQNQSMCFLLIISNVYYKNKFNKKHRSMGNTQKQNQNAEEIQVFHEKFKMVEILENTSQMILSIPFQQKSDVLEWEKLLKNIKDCDPEFLLMPKKYMIAQEGLCGSSGLIKIVFDSFTYSFEDEIKHHAQKFKHFQQPEIWYLLFAIISSVKEMDRVSLKVGDVRPYNIFVNENGQVKLSGIFSWPRQVQNNLKTTYDKTVTYLAPEELLQCRTGEKGKKSYIVGQSFSIGLTLLHTCLLRPMDSLYNIKKYEFNNEKLNSEIKELKNVSFWNQQHQKNQKYSEQLIEIIIGLLDLNDNKRLTSSELFQQLEPHAEQILNLKQFDIPKFRYSSPSKQPSNSNQRYSNEHRISPQYSSIKKKQFNEAQSLAFQIPSGLPNSGFPNSQTTIQNHQNRSNNLTVQNTSPQRIKRSNEKLQLSLNSGNPSTHPRGSYERREILSKQKYQSNPVANFNTTGIEVPNITIQSNIIAKTGDNATLGYERSSLNYPNSNYVSYQAKYDVPSMTQYRTSSQPFPIYFNQGTNFSYHKTADTMTTYPRVSEVGNASIPGVLTGIPSNIPSNIPSVIQYNPISVNVNRNINMGGIGTLPTYPFSRNVDLTTSGYTYIQKNANLVNNSQGVSLGTNYETSIVKPVLYGDASQFGFKQEPFVNPMNQGTEMHFLKKIDEQLNKSKQLYPTTNP